MVSVDSEATMPYGDPSSSPSRFMRPAPGRWCCEQCGAWNDPDNTNRDGVKECAYCGELEERP
jgi:hypothetical protein